jgi:hypothetical protein
MPCRKKSANNGKAESEQNARTERTERDRTANNANADSEQSAKHKLTKPNENRTTCS